MKLLKLLSVVIFLAATGSLAAIFSFTNPVGIGPLGVLIVFILLYLVIASFLFLALFGGVAVLQKMSGGRISPQARRWQVDIHRAYYIASVGALGPVLLLGINSVGQVDLQDVLLVMVLLGLIIFYIFKRT